MTDSQIVVSSGATSFDGPDAVHLFRAMSLKSSIGLWVKCGLIPTRGVGIKRMLAIATEYTGKRYTPKKAADAVADLTVWCETMKSALPIVRG